MRSNDDIIQFQRALNGSYEPVIVQPEQQTYEQIPNVNEAEYLKRNRRSLKNKKGRTSINRKTKKVKLTSSKT